MPLIKAMVPPETPGTSSAKPKARRAKKRFESSPIGLGRRFLTWLTQTLFPIAITFPPLRLKLVRQYAGSFWRKSVTDNVDTGV